MGNTEATDLIDAMGDIRGVAADRRWGESVALRMAATQAADEYIPLVLRKALTELELATGADAGPEAEPIENLLGAPRDYADSAVDELRGAGTPVAPPTPYLPVWEGLLAWTLLSASILFVATIGTLIEDGTRTKVSPAPLLLIPLIAACGVAARAIFLPTAARLGFSRGLAITVPSTALLAGGASVLALQFREPVVEVATLWGFAAVAVCLAGAIIAGRANSAATRTATTPSQVGDDDWFSTYERSLRLGGHHTDAEVARLTREARDHLSDSNSTPTEEFGQPAAYAAQMPIKRGVQEFRLLMAWAVLAVIGIGFLIHRTITDDFSWITLVGAAYFSVRTVIGWRTYQSARSNPAISEPA